MNDKSSLHQGLVRRFRGCLIAAVCVAGSANVQADIALQWQNTEMDERQQLLAEFLNESNVMTDLLSLLQENFIFEPSLKFVIGAGDGPVFDSEKNAIRFPYSYVSNALEAQMSLLEEGQTAIDESINLVEYTLYHLVAHAMVLYSSPEDDDQIERIASWLMIRGFDNGAEQMVSNARAFGAVSQKTEGTLDDYWHAHALVAARQRDIECWALGFDRAMVEPLLPLVPEPGKRVETCRIAWNQLDQQVQEWLVDELKPNAPIIND